MLQSCKKRSKNSIIFYGLSEFYTKTMFILLPLGSHTGEGKPEVKKTSYLIANK